MLQNPNGWDLERVIKVRMLFILSSAEINDKENIHVDNTK